MEKAEESYSFKDLSDLIKYAEKYNVEMDVLGAAVSKNAKLRLL